MTEAPQDFLVFQNEFLRAKLALHEHTIRVLEVSEEAAQQTAVKFKAERDRLRDAIKQHRLHVWGVESEPQHGADKELYSALEVDE